MTGPSWAFLAALLLCLLAVALLLRRCASLRSSEERHRLLVDNASDVIWTMDLDGRLTYVSPSVECLRGYSPAEVRAQPLGAYFLPESAARAQAALARAREAHQHGHPIPLWREEMEQPCRDGSTVWTEVRASGMTSASGQLLCIMGVTRDITERRRLQEELRAQATRDALTGVWSRARMEEQGRFEVQRFERYGHPLALVFMDLDHFKQVNDQHGHGVGDEVLKGFCAATLGCLRSTDRLGRWGGEEFLLLVPNTVLASARPLAERIRATLAAWSFPEAGTVTASLGVAQCRPGDTWETLVARADDALYRAKQGGRNRVETESAAADTALHPAGSGLLRLVWSEAYACGQPLIDAQHQDLFEGANGLLQALLEQPSGAELAAAIAALLTAVATHFHAEDDLLRAAGYAEAEAHARLHLDLLERGRALAELHRQGALALGDLFAYLAYEVVAQHMLKEDRVFFPLFRDPQVAPALECHQGGVA